MDIRQRIERLGVTQHELALMAGVSRGALHRVLTGEKVRGSTVSVITKALDALEGGDSVEAHPTVSTIDLGDGRTVTFEGSPEGVAEAALLLLQGLNRKI